MYTYENRVRYSEVNEDGKLSIPGIVNAFQDCTMFQSESLGIGVDFLKAHKRGWMLSAWQIVIDRRPGLNEKTVTATWPVDFKGFFGTRNFLMKDEAGEAIAYANSVWVFMDVEKGRPAKPTEEEIGKYVVEPAYEMECAPRKIDLPKEAQAYKPFPVRKHHLDTNHHVNNGAYVQMAMDVLEEADFSEEIRQVRVEYKKQAKYHDMIYPKFAKEEDRMVVLLCDEEEDVYAAVEIK